MINPFDDALKEERQTWTELYFGISSPGKTYPPEKDREDPTRSRYCLVVVSNYESPETFRQKLLTPMSKLGIISEDVTNSFT